jgi:phosphoglycerate dehydrogenase-like enzyme
LKWVQSCSSGVGHILDLGLIDKNVRLTNAAGVHANALAESIIAAILFQAKQFQQRINNQRDKLWQELHCTELTGQTVLIIGTGNIGIETAQRAKAFGITTVGIRRTIKPAPGFDIIGDHSDLKRYLKTADFVVIACPLTADTEGMIGAAELAMMKPNSYLINIARGKIIDETALRDSIIKGQIGGAYLDALTEEPLPSEHPLWDTPGITIVPHDSHSSPLIGDNIINVFTENLRCYVNDQPLNNLVDLTKGY